VRGVARTLLRVVEPRPVRVWTKLGELFIAEVESRVRDRTRASPGLDATFLIGLSDLVPRASSLDLLGGRDVNRGIGLRPRA
jgi:hypothetical protein